MDGFKKLPKMQCFKEGGAVSCKPVAKCSGGKAMKEGGKTDIKQDKAVVKKAFAMHDKQEHPGEKTDLSKLRKGGRTKKAVGTVKKFKCGGGVYGAKMTKEDIKNVDAAKKCKPKMLSGGGSALKDVDADKNPGLAKLPTDVRNNMGYAKKGGKIAKKMAGGGQPGATEAQQKYYDKNKANAKIKEDKALYEAVGSRGDAARKGMSEGRMDPMGTAYKKGGKAKKLKKYADGGTVMSDEEKNWLGGADATDPIILARMRSALGPKKTAPVAAPVKPETSADLDPYGVTRRETSADLDPYGAASKPVAAPRPRPAAKQNYIANDRPWTDNRDRGGNRFPGAPGISPLSGKSYKDLPSDTIGYQAPNVKPETSADLDPYGVTRRETAADLDPYNAASKTAAPYIDIPKNNPGMKQFGSGESPLGGMFNSLFKSRSQRNKKPVS
jgi:hypothetical protein